MIERMFGFGKLPPISDFLVSWCPDSCFFPDYGAPESDCAFSLDEMLWEIEMVHIYLAIWERWKKKKFLKHLWHEKGGVFSRNVAWTHWGIVMQCIFSSLWLTETRYNCLAMGFFKFFYAVSTFTLLQHI